MPKARAKASTASPAVRPIVAAAIRMRTPTTWLWTRNPWKSPSNNIHSLTKPLRGGSAAMPSVPTRLITELARM